MRPFHTAARFPNCAAPLQASVLLCVATLCLVTPVGAVWASTHTTPSPHIPVVSLIDDSGDEQFQVPRPGAADPYTLLQRMLNAQDTLDVTGYQVTVLYRPDGAVTSLQEVTRSGNDKFRLEYISPAPLAGNVMIDNGQISWHYMPAKKTIEIGPSRRNTSIRKPDFVMNMMKHGNLVAQLLGEDYVAGREADVVQVTANRIPGSRRFWIDEASGAQLKIESYGPDGSLQSTTYYTSVTVGGQLPANAFEPPHVTPDVQIVGIAPRKSTVFTQIPTDSDAGFHVVQPAYLPDSFAFQSASIFQIGKQNVLALRYVNGLTVLSVFETLDPTSRQSVPAFSRTGVLMFGQNGMKIVIIGNLPQSELSKVAASLR